MYSWMLANNNGSIRKGWTGTKYGWVAESLARMLHHRRELQEAYKRGDLYIPGFDALVVILSDDTLPFLVVASICYAWFIQTLRLLKTDIERLGELSVSEARSRFPITREWLKKLTRI